MHILRLRTRTTAALAALLVGAALGAPASLLLPVAAAHAQTPSTKADLAQVDRAIRAITTLKADFSQTDRNGQIETGTLLLKQPGHIRFDYGKGNDLLIVADGKSLYMIDYQVQQVQRWPIRNSPLGALLDPTRDLTSYGKIIDTGDPRVISIQVRDPKHPEYGMMSLVFIRDADAPAGLKLYGWITKDAQGNSTTIRLTNQQYGVPIADSAFRWKDPRGHQVGPRR